MPGILLEKLCGEFDSDPSIVQTIQVPVLLHKFPALLQHPVHTARVAKDEPRIAPKTDEDRLRNAPCGGQVGLGLRIRAVNTPRQAISRKRHVCGNWNQGRRFVPRII